MTSRGLHVLLWIAQCVVAAMFFFAFYAKVIQSTEEAAQMMPWVAEHPALATFAGIVDLLGALGLILPALLRIQPQWTTYAAYGGALLMIAGAIFHIMRGESGVIGLNFFLFALLVFIIWGRAHKVPIIAK